MTVATADEVAEKLGVDADKLKQHKGAYIGMAAQMGVFAMSHIGHYRAETSVVEEDLGIKLSAKEKEWVSLGNQLLLPPEIVKELNGLDTSPSATAAPPIGSRSRRPSKRRATFVTPGSTTRKRSSLRWI